MSSSEPSFSFSCTTSETTKPLRHEPEILTVSALTARVSAAIEIHLPPSVHVVGELSNFKRHSSGHLYFTLKDDRSELACVMWRSDATRMKFQPTDGLEVIATGNVAVFERAGKYQLYTRRLEPRGVGALEFAFRQLHEKLAKEGLFDPERKKPIPRFPQRIAVVTSPTGAAVRDIIRTIRRRFPCVDLCICPVRVQGESAAREIADAIRRLNKHSETMGGVDCMIVGRGGGSLEDLWAFNEEIVARAIFNSTIPVISAVGHEVDVTIADLVADLRAATPTAAAELAVPVREELIEYLIRQRLHLRVMTTQRIRWHYEKLARIADRPALRDPRVWIQRRNQIIDALSARLSSVTWRACRQAGESLRQCERLIVRIAPAATIRQARLRLDLAGKRLRRAAMRRLDRSNRRITQTWRRIIVKSPAHRIDRLRDRIETIERTMGRNLMRQQARRLDHVDQIEKRLRASSHETVLGRGFSITLRKKDKSIIRTKNAVHDHDVIITETAGGDFESRVINREQKELFE